MPKSIEWGQNEKRIEREMDLINQITDGSMVNTEKTRRMFIMQCPLEMVFMIFCSMGNR